MRIFVTICAVTLLMPFMRVSAAENITSFDANYSISADGRVRVVETIDYNFDGASKHGIFREIPYKYDVRGGTFTLRISDVSVTDSSGKERTTEISKQGGTLNIKIGDADTYVQNTEAYVISYTVERAVNFFDTHDELYWNVTGDEWIVPINAASARVTVADGVPITQAECFRGSYGSTESCSQGGEAGSDEAVFSVGTLSAGEGMTIVVGLPSGTVIPVTIMQKIWWFVSDNFILLLPFFVLAEMYRRWVRYGKDPKGRGSIVPQWEIPKGLTPLEMGTLIDERVHKKDISTLFIDLAIRGYFTINKTQSKKLFGSSREYIFIKQKDWTEDELPDYERVFLEGLFDGRTSTKLVDLKDVFYKDVASVTKKVYAASVEKGLFVKNPNTVRGAYLGSGIAIAFMSIWLGGLLSAWLSPYIIIVAIVSGIVIVSFSFVMPKRTKQGVLAREEADGLKRYLSMAEKKRLAFHNNPDTMFEAAKNDVPAKTIRTFEKYLPYAMILGVEQEWSKQFEDVYGGREPAWYTGDTNLSTVGLTNSLAQFTSTAQAAGFSQPSQSSSGGSGFSGGGSGGGGGGGGGGSW